MAYIGKTKNGTWRAEIRASGYKPIYRTFKSKKDATLFVKDTESRQALGTYQDSGDAKTTSFLEAINLYEDDQIRKKRRSLRQLQVDLNRLKQSKLAKVTLINIKARDLIEYRNERLDTGIAVTTWHKEHVVLNCLFTFIMMELRIFLPLGNPMSEVSKPKPTEPTSRDRRLQGNEEEELLKDLHKKSYQTFLAMVLALDTGMRRSELCNIRYSHINIKRKELNIPVTKTNNPRRIPLSEEAFKAILHRITEITMGLRTIKSVGDTVGMLNHYLPQRGDEKLFSIKPDSISLAFKRTCERLNISGLNFHDLRHEAISRLFEMGLSVIEVASISGHKDVRMLQKYTHLKPEDIANKINSFRSKSHVH